jgi:hypothetical protein
MMGMTRTQVQLTDAQISALREISSRQHLSLAELVRTSVDLFLSQQQDASYQAKVERAKAVVGGFSSGSSNGSQEHDRLLAEAYRA